MIYIKEEYEYDKDKVKVEVICPRTTTEKEFKEAFGPTHTWKRITSDDAYQVCDQPQLKTSTDNLRAFIEKSAKNQRRIAKIPSVFDCS